MAFQIIETEDPARLRLIGDLDLHTERDAADVIRSRSTSGSDLTLDLSELDFMDSSGVRVVVNAFKDLRDRGHQLILLAPKSHVKRLFELLGLTTNGIIVLDASGARGD